MVLATRAGQSELDPGDQMRDLFGSAVTDPAARDEIVRMYYPLAQHRARRFAGRGEPLDDLVQVASMALLAAIGRFDTDLGTAFATYAVPTIDGALKRHFRDKSWMVRVPRRVQEAGLLAQTIRAEAAQELRREPTIEEIASRARMDEAGLFEGMRAARAYRVESLDTGGYEDDPHLDVADPDNAFDVADVWESLVAHVRRLPERSRRVLYFRLVDDLSQAEIAAKIGISQMQVSRLLSRARSHLREEYEREPRADVLSPVGTH